MKIQIHLSAKHSVCPNVLKDFFYRFGCKSQDASTGFVQNFTSETTCHFNELVFRPEEDLLTHTDWSVEAIESESVAVMSINGRPVAATIHAQIRGKDGGIKGKAALSNQVIGELLKSLPAQIRHIGLFGCDLLDDLNPIVGRTNLLTLSLAQCSGIHEISPLRDFTTLQSLDLSDLERLVNIEALGKISTLRELVLHGCRSLEKIDPLAACTQLEALDLSTCSNLASIEALRGLSLLKNLNLFQCSKVTDFSPISALSLLEKLNISGNPSFTKPNLLAGLVQLRELDISTWGSAPSGTDLNFLSRLEKLEILEIDSWWNLQDISALARMHELENLNLGKCAELTNLFPLAGLTKLTSIGLEGCKRLRDLSPLKKIPNLKSLSRYRWEGHADFSGCENLEDLNPLSDLQWISDLQLKGCRALSDLAPLSRLSNLESLNLAVCASVSNLGPLGGLSRLKKLNLQGCKRLKNLAPLDSIAALKELECDFHPAQTIGILARAAWLRRDTALIEKCGWEWGKEAMACEKQTDPELEKLVTILCATFSLLGEHKLAKPTENLLDRHPEFSSAPWKSWFGGTLKESGFDLYRQRVERVPIASMLPGAIGGACATLPFEQNADWSRKWLAELEKARLADAKALLSVAPEICLAHARLGEIDALGRWLVRFTDPSDPTALDPIHAALAGFQLANQNLPAAENHIFAIQFPKPRDPLLAKLVSAIAESDPERASAKLLLIETSALRSELAKRLAAKPGASETTLQRLAVAMGDSPTDLAELIISIPDPANKTFIETLSSKLQPERNATLRKIAEEFLREAEKCIL